MWLRDHRSTLAERLQSTSADRTRCTRREGNWGGLGDSIRGVERAYSPGEGALPAGLCASVFGVPSSLSRLLDPTPSLSESRAVSQVLRRAGGRLAIHLAGEHASSRGRPTREWARVADGEHADPPDRASRRHQEQRGHTRESTGGPRVELRVESWPNFLKEASEAEGRSKRIDTSECVKQVNVLQRRLHVYDGFIQFMTPHELL